MPRFLKRAAELPFVLLLLVLALFTAAAPAYAAGVTADVQAFVTGSYTGANGLGSVAFSFKQSPLMQFSAGTSSGQADLLFSDSRTLTASSTENLDLAGVLADPLGATLTFVHVKAIYIHAWSTNTNNVVVGGAASNGFVGPFGGTTPTVSVAPGATLLLTGPVAGWGVTASTGDLLKVANSSSGSSVKYDVIIIGTST